MAHKDLNAQNFLGLEGGDAFGERQAPAPRFLKTKMCKFHAVGMCTKGNECAFAHGDRDLRPLPDFYKTRLCKMWMNNGHCAQPNCSFAHSKEEIRQIRHTDEDDYRKESVGQGKEGKGARSRSGQAMLGAKGGLPNGMGGYSQPPPPPSPYPGGLSGGPQGYGDFGGPRGGPCGGFDNAGSPGLQQDLMMLLQNPEIKKLAESILGPSGQGMPGSSSSVSFADGRGLPQGAHGMFDNFGQMGQGQDSFGRRFPDGVPSTSGSAHGAVPMRTPGMNMYGDPLGPFPTDYSPQFPNPNSLPQMDLAPNQFGDLDELLAALICFPSNPRPSTDASAA